MNMHHEWRLVAPTYSMPGGRSPRGTAPIFQKYDTSDLVNAFLKNPQKAPAGPSLAFTNEDRVHVVRKTGRIKFMNLEYRQTERLKLFLDTHKRYYLVVCELHCDVFGFPNASREGVCEAGFVIRRRHWEFEKISRFNEFHAFRQEHTGSVLELDAEATRIQGRIVHQRWVPDPNQDGVGAWTRVDAEKNVLDETIYPLLPLIPDPRKKDHAAAGRTIYFGLVPTANTNVDALGQPQFDDDSVYEVRCFVRRHQEGCPKKPTRADCKGPLVWSAPTEQYQLAAHFDLIGTSYRTINVKMPDLRALKAQAAIPKIGLRAPVRFQLPPQSGVEIGTPAAPIPSAPQLAGGICFRNIPLTTIVAMFAYNILKPIVVRIFQLYYLEPLEFCLPSGMVSLGPLGTPSVPLPSPPAALKINPEEGSNSPTVDASEGQALIDMAKDLESVGSLEGLKEERDNPVAVAASFPLTALTTPVARPDDRDPNEVVVL